ncbi:MAG: LytTR family transcriptional regulator [Haliscomenobacteraceae bacterium CHB4]|nr:LytTR family transcriptional regulator [Haliscomenobacteraceae bacterium CHB4]
MKSPIKQITIFNCHEHLHHRRRSRRRIAPQAEQKPTYRQRFLVNWREELVPVPVAEVAYFITNSGISWLVRSDGKRFVVDETMEEVAAQLDPGIFFRLNRQVIARPEAIKQIHEHFNGKLKDVLQPNLAEEVFVSRQTAPEFRAWLNR